MLIRCALLLVLALCPASLMAQVADRYYAVKDQALRILVNGDSYQAIEFVQGLERPTDAMAVFQLLSRDLYWENRNLPAALAIGRAGVQYGIIEAARRRENDAIALELRSQSEALAYDLSSFCWPGWNEPGILIDDSSLMLAQDLAKTNLRLTMSLQRGDLPKSRAYWLIGAHHLAVDQHESARRAFVESLKYAIAAEAREQELLLRGYIYLSDMLKDEHNTELYREFEFVLRDLEASREGTFFRQQLETAQAVFIGLPDNQDLSESQERSTLEPDRRQRSTSDNTGNKGAATAP